jgi:DEAD/DEAH box helicase domain-containing protein
VGFTERGYTAWEEMVAEALRLLEDCPCTDGCPSCVGLPILRPAQHQDPDVMNGFPIPDKGAARVMLRSLLEP